MQQEGGSAAVRVGNCEARGREGGEARVLGVVGAGVVFEEAG